MKREPLYKDRKEVVCCQSNRTKAVAHGMYRDWQCQKGQDVNRKKRKGEILLNQNE